MYFDFTVPVPESHVVRITKGSVHYVYYECSREYVPDKKYNSAKRLCIGKQTAGDRGLMHPNQNFLACFPGYEVPEEKSAFARSSCLRIGAFLVIERIARSLGIKDIVKELLGEKDGGLFLDFAAYSIVTEGNAAQYYPEYAYNHALFTKGMTLFSDSKISSLLATMPEDAASGFLNEWNRTREHRQKIYISYDSTNKNSQAGELELVEFGHPKDDKGLPVFGYSIAYDRTNSIPLFYEQYPGSIVDVSQLEFMLGKAAAYGYEKATFILDRGYFSKANIHAMEGKGYDFIIMLKGMHDLANSIIEEKRGSFESSRDHYIRNHSAYGTTVERKLYADDVKPRYIHLYHSNQRKAAESGKLERKLNTMMDTMDKLRNTAYVFRGGFLDYFNLTYNRKGTFLMYEEKKEVMERQLNTCGYFCILTSEKMSAKDALEIYKSRDENEKLFRGDKSYMGDKSMRVYSDESTYSKILIEFVALIIRCRLHTYIKDTFKNESTKPNYATVPAAVRELEKIEMTRGYDGIYRLDHAVTKHQKDILGCFGMDANMVKAEASEISRTLAIQKREST
jgi:hypothetical protein